MLSRLVWVLLPLLRTCSMVWACPGAELPREVALALFKDQVLGRIGLGAPPVAPDFLPPAAMQGPGRRPRRSSRAAGAKNDNHKQDPHASQIIVFPSADSMCSRTESRDGKTATSLFSYYLQPSINNKQLSVTSAHFWFYAGLASNSSAPLYILTSEQHLVHSVEAPSVTSMDGWTTYDLGDQHGHAGVYSGPFVLQVRCADCLCHVDTPEKMPFLHLHARPRVSGRSPRHVPTAIPWSPFAVDLLQRPSQQQPENSDCWREEVNISFDELGWGNWIVDPKAVTFSYCHGNCSAPDRTTASLGIKQCCAPVPESMQSLRITTTSDGGYSFKYETLPNIMPEECTCV